MDKYNYCTDCKRIFTEKSSCPFCKSTQVSELNLKSPVNILGTKVKGRVANFTPGGIKILVVDEDKSKSIREIDSSKLRKIL